MKKLLVIFLMFLALPCFAGNLLQQEDEVRFAREIVAEDQNSSQYSKEFLLQDDYRGYLQGKDSLYGAILYALDELPKNSIDYKYLDIASKKYELAIKNNNAQLFKLQKIIIDDIEYKQLKKNTRVLITCYNIIAY